MNDIQERHTLAVLDDTIEARERQMRAMNIFATGTCPHCGSRNGWRPACPASILDHARAGTLDTYYRISGTRTIFIPCPRCKPDIALAKALTPAQAIAWAKVEASYED